MRNSQVVGAGAISILRGAVIPDGCLRIFPRDLPVPGNARRGCFRVTERPSNGIVQSLFEGHGQIRIAPIGQNIMRGA